MPAFGGKLTPDVFGADCGIDAQYHAFDLSADEVIEFATAFRNFGFWRLDLDSGHVFASEGFFRIYDMPYHAGPVDMVAVCARIHAGDLVELMHTFEKASREKRTYHSIFRVRLDADGHKYVRAIGKFRDKPGTSGEIIGMSSELFDRLPGGGIFPDDWP